MREQLDSPSFQGLATFGMRPFVADAADLDTIKPDIGVVGAPWDSGTTNRPGARFGPRALRADAYDPGTYHLDLGIEIFDHLSVVDYGDAITKHGLWEASRASIYQRVSEVTSRGIIPVVLGGDHSVTDPVVQAVAEAHGGRLELDEGPGEYNGSGPGLRVALVLPRVE